MSITLNSLYHETLNFFRNQFTNILILALLTSIMNVIFDQFFFPKNTELFFIKNSIYTTKNLLTINFQKLIQELTAQQKYLLLKASAIKTFISLISNVFFIGNLLIIIQKISDNQYINILRSINLSAPFLPRLLLVISLITFFVQLGLLIIIIPGILLAIAFSLSPILIMSNRNISVMKSMYLSIKFAYFNLNLLAPPISLWLLVKLIILLTTTQLLINNTLFINISLNILNNIISSLIIIYLYRLNMLSHKT